MPAEWRRRRTVVGIIGLCVASAAAGGWLGWNAGEFSAQDRCLDAGGGNWNSETRFCEFAEAD